MSADALEPEFIDVMCEDEHAHWPIFYGDTMESACTAKSTFLFVTRPARVTCPKCEAWLKAHPEVTSWDTACA